MTNWLKHYWFPALTVLTVAVVVIVTQSLPTLAEFPGQEALEPVDAVIPDDTRSIESGEQIVTTRCVSCHSLKYLRNPATQRPYEAAITPAQALTSFGKVPPDLSTISRARRGGADYIYSLLTGYDSDPGDCTGTGGRNNYFSGGCIGMPDPGLSDEQALEVAAFLETAGEPTRAIRIRTGISVMVFMTALTALSYLVYRRIKKRILK